MKLTHNTVVLPAVTLSEPRFTRGIEEGLAKIARDHNVSVLALKHRLMRLIEVAGVKQNVSTDRRG